MIEFIMAHFVYLLELVENKFSKLGLVDWRIFIKRCRNECVLIWKILFVNVTFYAGIYHQKIERDYGININFISPPQTRQFLTGFSFEPVTLRSSNATLYPLKYT